MQDTILACMEIHLGVDSELHPHPCFPNLPSGVTLNKDTPLLNMGNKYHHAPPPLAPLSSPLRILQLTLIGRGVLTSHPFWLPPMLSAAPEPAASWHLGAGWRSRAAPAPLNLHVSKTSRWLLCTAKFWMILTSLMPLLTKSVQKWPPHTRRDLIRAVGLRTSPAGALGGHQGSQRPQ